MKLIRTTKVSTEVYSFCDKADVLKLLISGRVHVKLISKRKNQELKRDERRKKANQLRSKKREDILAKKRAIGGSDSAPFLSAIIPIGESANLQKLLKQMKECDADAKVEITGCNIMHIK